ncbi:MAG: DEAD/DEAH box helicase, partial [Thermoplasmata archaeon]|nr:DEAD/DEAH box helicase [Thermoplasmata archaeon]
GITKPTEAQLAAVPRVLAEEHLLLIAPTGMGKTEAVTLPLLDNLLRRIIEGDAEGHKGFQLLYITPLRALNRDMLRRIQEMGRVLGITVGVRHSDTTQAERNKQSRKPPQVLITTPETLQIMFTGKLLRQGLSRVRVVVIDEVHELATDERGAQLSVALERLVDLTGREFQRVALSATVGSPERVRRFMGGRDAKGRDRPVAVEVVDVRKLLEIDVLSPQVDDAFRNAENRDIRDRLRTDYKGLKSILDSRDLVREHEATLWFVNTRDTAEILASRLMLLVEAEGGDPEEAGQEIGIHHGSLSRDVRISMEEDFKSGHLRGLICTSSLELGIDVGLADFVIQYNSPRTTSRLMQRVGRASHRAYETSKGTVVATNPDDAAEAMAVVRRSLEGELEETWLRMRPLSVLANQLVSSTLEQREWDARAFFDMVRRAYVFWDLSWEEFQEVLSLLAEVRVIWYEEGRFGTRRASRRYFQDNLSMIPDEKSFAVVDIASRRFIGTLDEAFVANYAEPSAKFIVKGVPWIIVDLDEDSIVVERSSDLGAIPSWVGEDLPVPFEVAQEVGRMRGGADLVPYSADEATKKEFRDYLAKQMKAFPVPSDRLITVESEDSTVIINACFGSRVNETIGRALASLTSARFGASVGIRTDAYRIFLEMPRRVGPQAVVEMIQALDPASLPEFMRLVLRRSPLLRWQLFHVARKFGIIERGADHRHVGLGRLLSTFEGTVLMREVVDKVLFEKMDVERTQWVMDGIKDGTIDVVTSGLSPIGLLGQQTVRELVAPDRASEAILTAMGQRLEDEQVVLACTSCGAHRKKRVGDVTDEELPCEHCGSVLVAALHPRSAEEDLKLLTKRKKEDLSKEERGRLKRLLTNANLVWGHGRRAVMALSSRGVGPAKASKVLAMRYPTDETFLRALLAEEVLYARTKRFWD